MGSGDNSLLSFLEQQELKEKYKNDNSAQGIIIRRLISTLLTAKREKSVNVYDRWRARALKAEKSLYILRNLSKNEAKDYT